MSFYIVNYHIIIFIQLVSGLFYIFDLVINNLNPNNLLLLTTSSSSQTSHNFHHRDVQLLTGLHNHKPALFSFFINCQYIFPIKWTKLTKYQIFLLKYCCFLWAINIKERRFCIKINLPNSKHITFRVLMSFAGSYLVQRTYDMIMMKVVYSALVLLITQFDTSAQDKTETTWSLVIAHRGRRSICYD